MSYVRRNNVEIAELRSWEILVPGTDRVIGEYSDYEVKVKSDWGFSTVCRRGEEGQVLDDYPDVIATYDHGVVYDRGGTELGTYDGWNSADGLAAAGVLLFFNDDILMPDVQVLDQSDRVVAIIKDDGLYDSSGYNWICSKNNLPGYVSGYEIFDNDGVKQGEIRHDGGIYYEDEYLGCCTNGSDEDTEYAAIILTLMRSEFNLRETESGNIDLRYHYNKVGSMKRGTILNYYGDKIGFVKNGTICDRYGQSRGYVDGDYVCDSRYNRIGIIYNKEAEDLNGNYAGEIDYWGSRPNNADDALAALLLLRDELDLPELDSEPDEDDSHYDIGVAAGAAAGAAVGAAAASSYRSNNSYTTTNAPRRNTSNVQSNVNAGRTANPTNYNRNFNNGKTIKKGTMVAIPWMIAFILMNIQGAMSQMGTAAVSGGLAVSIMFTIIGLIYILATWRKTTKKIDNYYIFPIFGTVIFLIMIAMDLSYILWFIGGLLTCIWWPTNGLGLLKNYQVIW